MNSEIPNWLASGNWPVRWPLLLVRSGSSTTGRAEEQPTSSCLKSKEISDDDDEDTDDDYGEDGAQEKPLVAEEPNHASL